MKNAKNRLKIGIIGAGAAGLTSAWLLDEDYEVTVFEKEDRLGGHVCTVPVTVGAQTVHVEAGAEFFSDMMFPQFVKLLKALKVSTRSYPLTYTFYHTNTNQKIVLPPIHDGAISWQSLTPHTVFELVQLRHFVNAGKNILEMKDYEITLSDFAETIMLTTEFKNEFLYPFFAASWGVSPEEIKSFSAYDVIKWALVNEPAHIDAAHWNEVVGGMSTYVAALAVQLKNTHIHTTTQITGISYKESAYTLETSQGEKHTFDHIIVATNASIARDLLADVPHAQQTRDALALVEYFYTTIAIHGDRRFMPESESDWSVANIRYDGINSALTVCKPWMQPYPIFRSWITYTVGVAESDALPHPLYALKHFYHPKVNYGYFKAQEAIAKQQGNHNLWIAGFYTIDADSHNNAIVSAMHIAEKLAPGSARLAQLVS